MDEIKEIVTMAKKLIKRKFDQTEWMNFGIADKRGELYVVEEIERSYCFFLFFLFFLRYLFCVFFVYFQAVSIQGFASTTLAGVIGSSVLGRVLKVMLVENGISLGATLDRVNPTVSHLSVGQVYGALQEQVLMVTMKEIYGWLTLISLFCLLVFVLHESSLRPYKAIHPAYRLIRRFIKHELRMRERTS